MKIMIKNSFSGQIYKVHSNAYYVKNATGELVKCGARGLLKKNNDKISVGDNVLVSNDTIESVMVRKNFFIRPNVANVDQIIAVIAPEPKPDFYLLDKLLINANKENVPLYIVVNKNDLGCDLVEYLIKEYSNLGVKIFNVSALNNAGINELKNCLKGKLSVLAGQSAVGKTSLVNAMFNLSLKTGELSDKILRGKHTTTRSEIFEKDGIKLIDSPGFAVIDASVTADELCEYYAEYLENSNECKFRGCKHLSEPNCKIKELVENGKLSKDRYQRYLKIYSELLERRTIYEKN